MVAPSPFPPAPEHPGESRRFRCRACGNRTRFDVTTTRTVRAFHHYTLGGELNVEEVVVLDEQVNDVTCRWCGSGADIEPLTTGPLEPGPGRGGS